ncbi:MAG: DUF4080 domain-containing protein [Campylobacterales bacterium]
MHSIVLTTFNARYSHASLALRYLYANLHELREQSIIREFVINENLQQIAERILSEHPKIVGISTYIWNASDVAELIGILKKVSPQTYIVLGGPEASHLPHRVDFSHADYIISGEGEVAFYGLCRDLLHDRRPEPRVLKAPMVDVASIKLPYDYYDENDIAHRYVYLETSRGCPYLCEFCLSAIDEKMRYFDIDVMTDEFEKLWQRGVRSFKFIDRTFNLKLAYANRILDFFLAKDEPLFLHFEVIPDHFPEALRGRIARFGPAALQLEVGIQTLNPKIADNIHRPLRLEKIRDNLRFLEEHTHAHLHLDLIVGLPGETLESFAQGLNTLVSWSSGEIQIGILKKLSGTTMSRHDDAFGMVYADTPPYDVLKTAHVSFGEIQKMKRFARYWDILYNSGNFSESVRMLWPDGDVFSGFGAFSDWVYAQTAATWKIAQERMAKLLFAYLTEQKGIDKAAAGRAMASDLSKTKGKRLPAFLRGYAPEPEAEAPISVSSATKRQQRRL